MVRVSAIIPVYNGEATVARAIDSALAQDFDGMEVVVVNDGSTDSTARVLAAYGSRIKVVTQPNRGPAAARNAGVAASEGKYLAFLDGDDLWLPGKLAKTCNALEKNPRAALAFSESVFVNEKGETVGRSAAGRAPSMQDLLSRGWEFFPSAVVMARRVFDLCGGFCEEFRRPGGEDPWMWLLAKEHGEFEYVAEPLTIYRVPDFAARADKYELGRRIFARLVRERYGKAAQPLIDSDASFFVPCLVQKALMQMDAGDRIGALRTWLRAFRLKPSYFVSLRHVGRLVRSRNLERLSKALIPARRQAQGMKEISSRAEWNKPA